MSNIFNKRKTDIFTVLFFLVCCSHCHSDEFKPFKKLKGTLKISAPSPQIGVIKELASGITAHHPEIRIILTTNNDPPELQNINNGNYDIISICQNLDPGKTRNLNLLSTLWAIEAIAVIVNPKNPISELSENQLLNIYSGKIQNWGDIGGGKKQIHLYGLNSINISHFLFSENNIKISKYILNLPVTTEIIHAVKKDLNSIGYIRNSDLTDSVKKIIINKIKLTEKNIYSGKYQLIRQFCLVTLKSRQNLVQAFIKCLQSEEGKKIIRKYRLYPKKN